MSTPAEASATVIDLTTLSPKDIITFAQGLVGQPDWKRFVLLTVDDDNSIGVLQSIDNAQLSLMVTDPLPFLPAYSIELSDADRAQLGLGMGDRPLLLTTLSLHGETLTANLLGPLVINPGTRAAKQIVLADSTYTTCHPLAQVSPGEA
jgi:flagellar assembly factor FliW